MKKLFLPILLLSISLSSFAQTEPVDLKIKEEPKVNTGFMGPKGYLITGLTLNVVGTGIALLADELVKDAPVTYSITSHQEAIRIVGDNPQAIQEINRRSQQKLNNDIQALEQREKKVKGVKTLGVTGLAVGLIFDVAGIVNLFKTQ